MTIPSFGPTASRRPPGIRRGGVGPHVVLTQIAEQLGDDRRVRRPRVALVPGEVKAIKLGRQACEDLPDLLVVRGREDQVPAARDRKGQAERIDQRGGRGDVVGAVEHHRRPPADRVRAGRARPRPGVRRRRPRRESAAPRRAAARRPRRRRPRSPPGESRTGRTASARSRGGRWRSGPGPAGTAGRPSAGPPKVPADDARPGLCVRPPRPR